MKHLLSTPPVISIFFTVVIAISSCKKTDNTPSGDLENQVSSLFAKYHFQRNATAPTDGTILLPAENLSDLEKQLAAIDQVRMTPQQLDSIEKDFVKTIPASLNSTREPASIATPLDFIYGNTDVSLSAPYWGSKIVISATCFLKYAYFPINFNGIDNHWLVSGIIPGSATDVSGAGGNVVIISTATPPSQLVACRRTWLYKVTAKITSPFTMDIGYVARFTGYFNAGPDVPYYAGLLHLE